MDFVDFMEDREEHEDSDVDREEHEDVGNTEEVDREVQVDEEDIPGGSEVEEDEDEDGSGDWPDPQTAELIELWQQYRCLYDPQHKHYSDRDKKRAVLKYIAGKFKMTGKYK